MAFADDYVGVHERINQFLEKFPDGRIQTEIAKHTDTVVIMKATVYRTAEDDRPSVAHSQLDIPGKTNFTRGSEVENAETSAVGRALAFMGFETKKGIASREEVASRQGSHSRSPVYFGAEPQGDGAQDAVRLAEMEEPLPPHPRPRGTVQDEWGRVTTYVINGGPQAKQAITEALGGEFNTAALGRYLAGHAGRDADTLIASINRQHAGVN